jgi:two-component system heavy metal sensor histidine kinase CusS
MKLANRVSTFFLAALACVLIAYSVLVFGLVRYYLQKRFDGQLRSALSTLVAAVEVEDDDVKWEPSDHTVSLGVESDLEDIRWAVFDEFGKAVDLSKNLMTNSEDQSMLHFSAALRPDESPALQSDWSYLQHRLAAPHPKLESERDPLERGALTVTVARSTRDLSSLLNWLGLSLVVVSVGFWTAALVAGRWYCRKAIAPVFDMAAAARSMTADDTVARLPLSGADDELSDLAIAFNGLLDQLFDATQRMGRFAGDAAHQLRTPVTVLQGQIDVALRRPRDAAEYQSTLHTLRDQVGELRQTIEAMLFLARPDDRTQRPSTIQLELNDWLRQRAPRTVPPNRREDLQIDLGAAPIECRTVPALFEQLLDNLISNAFKYSEPGAAVRVVARRVDGEAVIEVEDHGIGIAADELESVFRPFYRSRQARHTGAAGSGLGLAISRRITTLLGGRLRCESRPGSGSVFSVSLPLKSASGIDLCGTETRDLPLR